MSFDYTYTVRETDALPLLKEWATAVSKRLALDDSRLAYGEAYTALFQLLGHTFSNVNRICLLKYPQTCQYGICVMHCDDFAIL